MQDRRSDRPGKNLCSGCHQYHVQKTQSREGTSMYHDNSDSIVLTFWPQTASAVDKTAVKKLVAAAQRGD